MIIIGAGGLAKQVLDVVDRLNSGNDICFFDNVSKFDIEPKLYDHQILQKVEEVISLNNSTKRDLILAIGNPEYRNKFFSLFKSYNLNFHTLVASSALIGKHGISISEGAVIMEQVVIESSVSIGKGVLINTGTKIFHDSSIGDFCEIAPDCSVLGKCKIGNEVFIGANATILPGIEIGSKSVIGAGAVVTKNVPANTLVKGVPGKHYSL